MNTQKHYMIMPEDNQTKELRTSADIFNIGWIDVRW